MRRSILGILGLVLTLLCVNQTRAENRGPDRADGAREITPWTPAFSPFLSYFGNGVLENDSKGRIAIKVDTVGSGIADRVILFTGTETNGLPRIIEGPVQVESMGPGVVAVYFSADKFILLLAVDGQRVPEDQQRLERRFGVSGAEMRLLRGAALTSRLGAFGNLRESVLAGRNPLIDNQDPGSGGELPPGGNCSTSCNISCDNGSSCSCTAGKNQCCTCSCSRGAQCSSSGMR